MNPEVISIVKDISTICATVTAAIVAVLGLRTWKKQLRGKTEYEIARRLLRTVYKVRNTVLEVRTIFISVVEMQQALKEMDIEVPQDDPSFNAVSQGAVYQRRWSKVQEALTDLRLESFEAEVLWGQDITDKLKPLHASATTLYSYLRLFLIRLENPPRISDEDLDKKIDETIYQTSDDPAKDPFGSEVIAAVEMIENYLRPRLKL